MNRKKKESRISKRQKRQPAFFDFQGNKFAKLARDYHHELHHLTFDLRRINQKIQESAALCHQQIGFIKKKSEHLISPAGLEQFENALYHLENFTFRITSYRDKMVQFINQALRIGFDEKTMGMLSTIANNRIVRDAHLDTELKKFDRNKDFKDVLSERVLLTHRRYYQAEIGYDSLMLPSNEVRDVNEKLKLWKQNVQAKTNRANRIVLKVVEINNRVMQKINNYLKKSSL